MTTPAHYFIEFFIDKEVGAEFHKAAIVAMEKRYTKGFIFSDKNSISFFVKAGEIRPVKRKLIGLLNHHRVPIRKILCYRMRKV